MDSLKFEWNDSKNSNNKKKHGVSFEEASTTFSDSLGRLIPDPEHSESEERYILMGMSSKFRVLLVCHCEKNSDTIRIISARKAEKFEQKQYEGYNHA